MAGPDVSRADVATVLARSAGLIAEDNPAVTEPARDGTLVQRHEHSASGWSPAPAARRKPEQP